MPNKTKVADSGDELEIPQDHVIEVSYSKAKQLVRKPREMSEKQRENIQRLVAMNKKKREDAQLLKQQQEAERQKPPTQKIVVKPKRVFKKKQEFPSTNEYIENKIKRQQETESESEYSEEDDSGAGSSYLPLGRGKATPKDEEEVAPVRPVSRPKPNKPAMPQPNPKIQEMEQKLKQIELSLNKPVQSTKYDNMMSKFFGKK